MFESKTEFITKYDSSYKVRLNTRTYSDKLRFVIYTAEINSENYSSVTISLSLLIFFQIEEHNQSFKYFYYNFIIMIFW